MIREGIEKSGYKDVKECARAIKVPYDLFNKVLGGHLPKDSQLVEYAKKLKLDSRELILAAYREKAPDDMKVFFNAAQILENFNPQVNELREIINDCNGEQINELLAIARLVHEAPREYAKKALALLTLYQQMDSDLMEYFDSLITLALRNQKLQGMKSFTDAISLQKSSQIRGRKTRGK